jgi:hypothetical protein
MRVLQGENKPNYDGASEKKFPLIEQPRAYRPATE